MVNFHVEGVFKLQHVQTSENFLFYFIFIFSQVLASWKHYFSLLLYKQTLCPLLLPHTHTHTHTDRRAANQSYLFLQNQDVSPMHTLATTYWIVANGLSPGGNQLTKFRAAFLKKSRVLTVSFDGLQFDTVFWIPVWPCHLDFPGCFARRTNHIIRQQPDNKWPR